MAGKALFPSIGTLSTGVIAGSPLTPFHYPIVETSLPPVIVNGRLAQLADATISVIAPGPSGAAHSFVMGELAIDSAGGARDLLIGYNLQTTQANTVDSADQTLLGNTLLIDDDGINSQYITLVGANIILTGDASHKTFGDVVAIGSVIRLIGDSHGDVGPSTVVGTNITTHGGQNAVFGDTASTTDSENAVFGWHAQGTLQSAAFGHSALADAQGVSAGWNARADPNAVAIGFSTRGWGDSGIAIGRDALTSGGIAIGREATTTQSDEAIIGSANYPIDIFVVVGSTPPAAGGVALFGEDFRGGAGVLYLGDAATPPSGAGAGAGGDLYSDAGALHWLDGAGVDHVLAGTTGSGTVVLASAFTTSSAAFTDVTGLSFAAVAGTYVLNALLDPQGDGSTGGIQLAINGANLTLLTLQALNLAIGGSVTGNGVSAFDTSFTSIGGTAQDYVRVTAVLVLSGAATVTIRARLNGGTGPVSVKAGSMLQYQKVA